MNPYLEQEAVWQDFHQSFMPGARAALAAQVAGGYVVKVEEYVFIHELGAEARQLIGRADVSVSGSSRVKASATAVAAVAPAYVSVPALTVDEERHGFLEIRDRQRFELVTVIELLSPSNKSGPDRAAYLNKRRRFLESGVNLVELDLLRGGVRLPMEGLKPCDYYALVARPEESPRGGIWAFRLADPLPTIPIPLRPPDPDASLDLKAILDRIYDEAAYEKFIYHTPPQPALDAIQEQWARNYLPADRPR
jgi:hypothetical protein